MPLLFYLLFPAFLLLVSGASPLSAQNVNDKGFSCFSQDNKYGLKKSGKVIVPAIYDQIGYRSFDSEGKIAITTNLIPVNIGATPKNPNKGKWGFIDTTGKIRIPIEYEGFYPISENRIAAEKGKKTGYLDSTGAVVIPFQYGSGHPFSEGLAFVTDPQAPSQYKCIDLHGKELFKLTPNLAPGFYGYRLNRCQVTQGSDLGFINKKGELVIPLEYHWLSGNFIPSMELARMIKKNEQGKLTYGLIDTSGQVIAPFYYQEKELVITENNTGNINQNGKSIVFHHKNDLVSSGNKSGFSDALSLGKTAYEKGQYEKALVHFRDFQIHRTAESLYYIGKMYAEGKGVVQNTILARKWLQAAVEKNYAPAQELLNTLPVTKD